MIPVFRKTIFLNIYWVPQTVLYTWYALYYLILITAQQKGINTYKL